MIGEIEVLKDVARRLEGLGLPYMLTGSFAMAYYATPRMTRDIDLVVAIGGPDVRRFIAAFVGDYYVPEGTVSSAVAAAGVFNLIHEAAVIKVDVIVRKNTPYRIVEFERRRQIEIAGKHIWVVAQEDLILSKLEWAQRSGSELQRRDVTGLLGGEVDWEYLRHWAAELGLESLLTEVARG